MVQSNWTVRPSSGCSVVLATHTAGAVSGRLHPDPGGEPLEHRARLQLDARPRAAGTGLQLRGVHVQGRQRPRPPVRQLCGRPVVEHGQDVLAKLHFLVRSNSQSSVVSVGGFQLEGYAMTLSTFAWNIVRTYTLTPGRRYSFGCRYRLGTASNLVMYVSAADNDYVGVTGTFLGTAAQGVWSTARLDFSVPRGGGVALWRK